MFNMLVVSAASPGTLCQLSDFQLDLLMFVATGLGPMVSLKDLRVGTRGELSLGLMVLFRSQILVIQIMILHSTSNDGSMFGIMFANAIQPTTPLIT